MQRQQRGLHLSARLHGPSLLQPVPQPHLSYKMSNMGKGSVSIRELQQNLKRVMARVERGEGVEVTRRRSGLTP